MTKAKKNEKNSFLTNCFLQFPVGTEIVPIILPYSTTTAKLCTAIYTEVYLQNIILVLGQDFLWLFTHRQLATRFS